MTDHRKEPWINLTDIQVFGKMHYGCVDSEGKEAVALTGLVGAEDHKESEANARRIAVCVNACVGISTDYLEHFGGTTFNDFKRVKHECDELKEKLAVWVEQNLELQALVQEKQAQIDALMLEYCPDEMTAEQVEEWKRNQKPVTDELVGSPE